MSRTRWIVGFLIAILGPAAASAADSMGSYRVVRGDSLWKIAAKPSVYGDPWKWPLLYEASRSQISHPDRIEMGWTLSYPRAPSPSQIENALLFARNYGERVPVQRAAPQPEEAAPPLERDARRGAAGGIALLTLLILAGGILLYRLRGKPQALAGSQAESVNAPLPEPTEAEAAVRADQGREVPPPVPQAAVAAEQEDADKFGPPAKEGGEAPPEEHKEAA